VKLDSIHSILESKFPVWDFIYKDYSSDPSPRALVLGAYDNPKTGNRLIAAINTRLLSTEEAMQLHSILDKVGAGTSLRNRVRILRKLSGGIFDKAYRTYNSDKIESVKKNFVYSNNKSYTKHKELSRRIGDNSRRDSDDVIEPTVNTSTGNEPLDNINATDKQEQLDARYLRKDPDRELQTKTKPGPTRLGKGIESVPGMDEKTAQRRDSLMDDEERRLDQQRTKSNPW
jgi:hypothetical protein